MSEMVERVARAIQAKLDDEFAQRGGLDAEEMAAIAARAAVEAMREPTHDMVRAGGNAQTVNARANRGLYYRAMIDAALSGG